MELSPIEVKLGVFPDGSGTYQIEAGTEVMVNSRRFRLNEGITLRYLVHSGACAGLYGEMEFMGKDRNVHLLPYTTADDLEAWANDLLTSQARSYTRASELYEAKEDKSDQEARYLRKSMELFEQYFTPLDD
ncbi:MAG: hypothetical protein ABIH25_03330 [Candidatus Woesearchaeota archaeon]